MRNTTHLHDGGAIARPRAPSWRSRDNQKTLSHDLKTPLLRAMDALKTSAAAALARGELVQAEELYIQAYAIAARDDDAVAKGTLASNLSHVCLKKGDAVEARAHARDAIAHRADWSKAHMRLGDVAFAERAYGEALEAYERAVALEPAGASSNPLRIRLERLAQLSRAATKDGVYFRQLSPGRDICVSANSGNFMEAQIFAAACQMKNYVYVVGDVKTRECVVIDACWDVTGIRRAIEDDKMNLIGAVATHYHFDHTGGLAPIEPFRSMGVMVPGVKEIVDEGLKCHIHAADADTVVRDNKVPRESLIIHDGDASEFMVGGVKLQFIHTPGHSPGSCVVVVGDEFTRDGKGFCVSGDTIFPGSCGRLDLKDASRDQMFHTLAKCARLLPDDMIIYPGHSYNGAFTTTAREKSQGMLRAFTKQEWDAMHGVA